MSTNSHEAPTPAAKPHWLDKHIAEQAAHYGLTVEQKADLFDGAALFGELVDARVEDEQASDPFKVFTSPRMAEIAAIVTNCLISLGWLGITGAALVIKAYPTAVGKRNALVYLKDFGRDSCSYMLAGDYQSQGCNKLESHCVLIPKDADATKVRQLVTLFAKEADVVVAGTYAARLLATRPIETQTI